MNVGVVGLGRMGRPLARRVVDAGHDVVVFNRTDRPAPELDGTSARRVGSIAEACADRDVIITMLSDDPALTEVVLAPQGLSASMRRGSIHLAMGTHGVDTIRELAAAHQQAGQSLVAAPVLGRPEVAAAGQVGIIAGGPNDAVRACAPLFAVMGRRTFEAGERPESAAAMKLANNLTLGCAIEVMGEAFALTRRYGVDSSVFYEVLTDGLFASVAYKVYGRIIADEAYERVGISARLGLKDANLALAAAQAAGVPVPSAEIWRNRLVAAIEHGDGEQDWSVVAREQARESGLE